MRLRDPFDVVEGGNDDISIPSGAIKSIVRFYSIFMIYLISIPSGAIKRPVQLSFDEIYKIISIPSGAIKSHEGYKRIETPVYNFNSFWCD